MSSDSAIPNLESKKAVSESTTSDSKSEQVDAVIPEPEVDSVLVYLQSNPDSTDNVLDIESTEPPSPANAVKNDIQVQIKSEAGKLLLILPTESQVPAWESSWDEIWGQMKLRLFGSDRFQISGTIVHLVAQDRLLDSRQLQELAEALNEFSLQLKSVSTSRRQTAIAAATAGYSVEQLQPETNLISEPTPKIPTADALYLTTTVRSGVEIRHPGSVIIFGDVNPGGIVAADGDILVWGRLRGIAHAGALGNQECLIMALQMEPTQLRIADTVARSPEKPPAHFEPEVAYITPQGIRITKSTDFSKNLLSRMNQES